jgi:mono/diheme cytochrome c family protein
MVKWLTAFLISLAATLFLKSMPSAAEAAPELFRELCSVCHGVGGKGDGPSAQGFGAQARKACHPYPRNGRKGKRTAGQGPL